MTKWQSINREMFTIGAHLCSSGWDMETDKLISRTRGDKHKENHGETVVSLMEKDFIASFKNTGSRRETISFGTKNESPWLITELLGSRTGIKIHLDGGNFHV